MRRAILFFLLGVCVFGAAALGGFYAASQLAPERLRTEAEAQLSKQLGAPVRLGAVRVSLTEELPWILVEASELRAGPLPGDRSIAIERASARLDPFLLILRRLELRGLALSGIEVSLPEPVAATAPKAASEEDPLTRAVEAMTRVATQLRAKPCPVPPVEADRIALVLTSASAPRRVLELDRVAFSCARLSEEGAWEVAGRALLADGAAAPLALRLSVAEDAVDAALSLPSVPLAPLFAALGRPESLSGRAQADLSWRAEANAPHALRLALSGRDIAGELGTADDPARAIALRMRAPKLALALTASERELRASELAISDGALGVKGSLALALPLSEASALGATAQIERVSRDDLARIAAQLPRGARDAADRALDRIVSGEIAPLEVALKSSVAGVREMAAGDVLARSGELELKLGLANAELRIGESDRLREVAGAVSFDGDTLDVQAASARFRERRLPRLSVKLHGVSRVKALDDLACDRPAPVPRIGAVDDLRAWVESRRRPPYTPNWTTLDLDVDRLSHPLLFCTLEDVVAEITRGENHYEYAVESGAWAGFAIEGDAIYRKARGKDGEPLRDGGSISAELTLGEKRAPAAPAADPNVWATGRFAWNVSSLGRFLTKSYQGEFRAVGSRAELFRSRLQFSPRGELTGELALEMGGDGPIPWEVDAESKGFDLLDLWKVSQAPKTFMSGTLTGGAHLEGHLYLGENPLIDARGYASVHARKGEIHRDVPFLLAVAMTDEKVDPFGKRDRFPYQAIDLEGPIENGWMTSRTLTLEGKSERMAATGKTHLSEPYELESVIGMYTIPTIDSIVGAIPIFNVLLLGEDRSLAGFYFQVTGEWTKPVVTPLVGKTVASGPASVVLEGVPNFVFGSLRALGEILTPPAPKKPAATTAPAPQAAPTPESAGESAPSTS